MIDISNLNDSPLFRRVQSELNPTTPIPARPAVPRPAAPERPQESAVALNKRFNFAVIVYQKEILKQNIAKICNIIANFPWDIIFYSAAATTDLTVCSIIILTFAPTAPILAITAAAIGGPTGFFLAYKTFSKIFKKQTPPPLPPRNNEIEEEYNVLPLPPRLDLVPPPLPPRNNEIEEEYNVLPLPPRLDLIPPPLPSRNNDTEKNSQIQMIAEGFDSVMNGVAGNNLVEEIEEFTAPQNDEISDDEWNYEDERDLDQMDTLWLRNNE